jgi:hypothetical protein
LLHLFAPTSYIGVLIVQIYSSQQLIEATLFIRKAISVTKASEMEPVHTKAESSSDTEGGLAVRQTEAKSTIPRHVTVLDGPESPPASGMSGSESGTSPPASPRSASSVGRMRDLEKPTLGSPFHSPKIAPSNGSSRTSLDDGKLGDGALGTCASILDTSARDTNAGSQPIEATEVLDVVQKDADVEASTGKSKFYARETVVLT